MTAGIPCRALRLCRAVRSIHEHAHLQEEVSTDFAGDQPECWRAHTRGFRTIFRDKSALHGPRGLAFALTLPAVWCYWLERRRTIVSMVPRNGASAMFSTRREMTIERCGIAQIARPGLVAIVPANVQEPLIGGPKALTDSRRAIIVASALPGAATDFIRAINHTT